MGLPSIDAPSDQAFCRTCGNEIYLVDPAFCAVCYERAERQAASDRMHERHAAIRAHEWEATEALAAFHRQRAAEDLVDVRKRARLYNIALSRR